MGSKKVTAEPGDVTLTPAWNMVTAVVVLIIALVIGFLSINLKQKDVKSDIKNYPRGTQEGLEVHPLS